MARGKYRDGIAWTKIFKANRDQIRNPDLIYPYQQFIIPD
ncbi:MAG: LysM peptidoglycan-binding domain-containing protein [Bacteroidales bacterium]|nr:LysM peptidoglycan-binding domain-containing protein [Bacteroidales bacterium]